MMPNLEPHEVAEQAAWREYLAGRGPYLWGDDAAVAARLRDTVEEIRVLIRASLDEVDDRCECGSYERGCTCWRGGIRDALARLEDPA